MTYFYWAHHDILWVGHHYATLSIFIVFISSFFFMTKQKIKVGLLCNNKMAVPALMRLMREGVLCGVATGDTDAEAMHMVRASCQGGERSAGSGEGVPYTVIGRKGHKQQIRDWVWAVQPDVVFVITFPYRIPGEVLAMPRLGFLNFHFGLLPEMRGADPIFECIRQRLPVAGATVHVMDEGLDTGPVVLRQELSLSPEFTYGMLSGQMAMLGENMCGEVLLQLAQGLAPATIGVPQDESKAKYWPKVGEADITIRWDKMPADDVIALVRACNPVGRGVPTSINGWKIGVVDICHVNLDGDASVIAPGTIIAIDHQNGLIVCCMGGRAVKLEVVYTSEGYFPGYKIALFGVGQWGVFG
jgi:methionyl-tRNA formyltransferase